MSSRPFVLPGQQPPTAPPRFPGKPTPNKPPRRGFLGAAAVLIAAPAAASMPAPGADAELIAECAAAIEAHRAAVAVYRYPLHLTQAEAQPYESEADRLDAVSDRHVMNALRVSARPWEGLIAKARMALAIVPRMPDGRPDLDWHAHEAWAVVEEVLRLEALA